MEDYHILSLSGGKDSTALAFFMRENCPEVWEKIELVFCDTECELPEIYDYLNKIEVFLDKKITRIKPQKSFEQLLSTTNFLPSYKHRWCTGLLKMQPLQKYIKKLKDQYNITNFYLYIGIRADELPRTKRAGKNSLLKEVFPFVEHNICKKDVIAILTNSGIGLSNYYNWRKRSGCYFCFYQSCIDWLNLYKHHPDLYKKAMSYEYNNCEKIKNGRMGFNMKYSLSDMIKPCNIEKIKDEYEKNKQNNKKYIDKNLIDFY